MAQRDADLLPRLQALKAEPPYWGDRRLWAYLRVVELQPVNKQRGLRGMREHHLLVNPHLKLQAQRTLNRSQPRPTTPQEWWGSEMTKGMVAGFGWGYIGVVLEWYTKKERGV